jgi:hypothetical protein
MADAVTAIRADMAAIAEGVDPRLTERVAELDGRVEKHSLMLSRLLEVTPAARRREGDL